MYDFLLVRHCNYSSTLYHFSSYLMLNNIVTLKSGLEVTQDHWMIETGAIRKLGCGFLFAFYSNYGHIVAVCEIFSVKEWCDFENWKWRHLIDRIWVPIRLPLQLWRYLVSSARYSDLLVENHEIFIPHLYLAPLQGVTLSEFCDVVWCS